MKFYVLAASLVLSASLCAMEYEHIENHTMVTKITQELRSVIEKTKRCRKATNRT